MGKVIILPETTLEPITLIGERAGICWGADTSDAGKNYRRGLDCIRSEHGRAFEFVNVEMVLDGYSARVIREWYTHIGGMPTRLQESTRYVDSRDFDYVVPQSVIQAGEAVEGKYHDAMNAIKIAVSELEYMGVPREDAAMLLPLGMTTRIVDRRNLRSLIDMSRQRTCTRAYWEFRDMFSDISLALANCGDEWAKVINLTFYPKCQQLKYCPEKHGCGKYPQRTKAVLD